MVNGRTGPLTARMLALSFLMLFVELALIRWTGSNILYLSYFSNFVLLASFLGIGLGFVRADARRNLFPLAPIGLAALVAFVRLFPVEIDRSGSELIFFGALGTQSGLPPWLTLPVLFLGVAGVMTLIGEGVARTFRRFPPLDAYRLDILGSLAGIIAFSVLSFLGAPPLAWGAVVVVALILLSDRRSRIWQLPALAIMLVLLGLESVVPTDSWSPYLQDSAHHPAVGGGVAAGERDSASDDGTGGPATGHRDALRSRLSANALDTDERADRGRGDGRRCCRRA